MREPADCLAAMSRALIAATILRAEVIVYRLRGDELRSVIAEFRARLADVAFDLAATAACAHHVRKLLRDELACDRPVE